MSPVQRSSKTGARLNLCLLTAATKVEAATAKRLEEARATAAEAQKARAKCHEEAVATSEAAMLTFAAAAAAAKEDLARLRQSQVQTVDSQVGRSDPAGLTCGWGGPRDSEDEP